MGKSQNEKLLLSQYGAHLVCAQFAARGVVAELVFQNAPKIDALLYDTRSGKTASIQIKTSEKKFFNTFSGTKKELVEEYNPNDWFVLVDTEKIDENSRKDRYFIVPGKEVKKYTIAGHEAYVSRPHLRSKLTHEEMDQAKNVHGVSVDQVLEYENRWDSIFSS